MRNTLLPLLLAACAAAAVVAPLGGCAAWQAQRRCATVGCPDDERITAEVRSLIGAHRELMPPNQVYVKTLDRVVYLTGQVATDLQRSTAVSLAKQAAGVRSVTNNIALTYRSGP